ncbi:NADase-type glycan-binding domain-containing protein [Streptomyces canarius]
MVCPDCGHRNVPGTRFCGSCQTFLEWEDQEQGGEPSPTTGPATPRPPEAPPSATSGPEAPTAAAAAPPPPAHPPATPPAAPPAVVPRRPDDPPHHPPGEAPAHHAGTPAVPPPRMPPRPDAPPRRHGRPCPSCRAENPHERRLCVRCGTLLDPAQPPDQASRPPWWRRILPSRDPRPPAAGDRPRLRVWRRPRLTLPVFLIVLVVAAWLARAQLTELFTFAQDSTGDPKPLHPVHVRASGQASAHRAQAAFDGFNNRYWAPAARGSGTGQYLEADFEHPVRMRQLLVTSGICRRRSPCWTSCPRPTWPGPSSRGSERAGRGAAHPACLHSGRRARVPAVRARRPQDLLAWPRGLGGGQWRMVHRHGRPAPRLWWPARWPGTVRGVPGRGSPRRSGRRRASNRRSASGAAPGPVRRGRHCPVRHGHERGWLRRPDARALAPTRARLEKLPAVEVPTPCGVRGGGPAAEEAGA